MPNNKPKQKLSFNKETVKNLRTKSNVKTGLGGVSIDGCTKICGPISITKDA
jgi:hypothetical protein